MTVIRRDFGGSAIGQWLREQRALDSKEFRLSVSDLDFTVHRWSSRNEARRSTVGQIVDHIQIVEVKTFGADMPPPRGKPNITSRWPPFSPRQ